MGDGLHMNIEFVTLCVAGVRMEPLLKTLKKKETGVVIFTVGLVFFIYVRITGFTLTNLRMTCAQQQNNVSLKKVVKKEWTLYSDMERQFFQHSS